MTITPRHKISLAAICGLVSCLITSPILAQTNEQSTPAEAKPVITQYLRVRNIRPAIIGWWLNPTNNPQPFGISWGWKTPKPDWRAEWHVSNMFPPLLKTPAIPLTEERFPKLPPGIELIAAIDPQNALLVRGTQEGLNQLQPIIEMMDKPIQTLSLDVQLLDISAADLQELKIDFKPLTTAETPADASEYSVGVISGYQDVLKALIEGNKAKVITAPQVTTWNNVPVSLISPAQYAVPASIEGITSGNGTPAPSLFQQTQIVSRISPTISPENTIRVELATTIQVPAPQHPQHKLWHSSVEIPNFTAQIKDGETIAIRGIRTKTIKLGKRQIPVISHPVLNIQPLSPKTEAQFEENSERELIILVTPRIIEPAKM